MTRSALHVITGELSGNAALDTAVSRAILQQVTSDALPETLQVGTPHRVMAFGKHDTLSGGFSAAVRVAVEHGYDPSVRIAGGRAVVFSPTIIRFAWTMRSDAPAKSMHQRFTSLSTSVVGALGDVGITGEIGEIPGEYCPGEYSVHILGSRKVMGVGQRLTRSAAQVGGMIVVADPDAINSVLVPAYSALDVPMDPAATGSLADARSVSTDDVSAALALRIADGRPIVDAHLDETTLSIARDLAPNHRPAAADEST